MLPRVAILLIVSLWVTIICQAAPQEGTGAGEGAGEVAGEGAGEGAGGEGSAEGETDLKEAKDMIKFLRDDVKMAIETIIQDELFQPKKPQQTVQDTMEEVLKLRTEVLGRIKMIRAKEIVVNENLNIKQEAFLNELRMDIMGVLLMLVEKDADTLDSLQKVGKALLNIRAKIVNKVMMLIMLRDTGVNTPRGACDCEPFTTLSNQTDPEEVKKLKDGENLDGNAILTHLNMQLMTVDDKVKMKYTDILAEIDEEKRKEKTEQLINLKEVSNCLNEVMIEVSGAVGEETDNSKLTRTIDRKLNQCTSIVNRHKNSCENDCPTPTSCDSCGADKIDEILRKLEDWSAIITSGEEGDEGKKDDIRDEALTFLNTLDTTMTTLLNNKIENTTVEAEKKCEAEKLEVIAKCKDPLWMLVNITIFGEDAMVEEMIKALIDAKTEMRKEYCQEDERTIVDTDSCDLEEIATAKEWTTAIDKLITETIFDPKATAVNVMLEIVKIKGLMEERVRELFKDNLTCREEVGQIKNIYKDQITKCLTEMMDPTNDFEKQDRPDRVACMKQLRNTIEERRGLLWMSELMKKIQQRADGSGAEEGS